MDECGHPARWRQLLTIHLIEFGAGLVGHSFAKRCLCSSKHEEGIGDIFSRVGGFASRVCAPLEGK